VSPSAVRCGYGLQSQFAPSGTESPSATRDHVRGTPDALVDEEVVDLDDDEQAVITQLSAIRPATGMRLVTRSAR
jgi:hypothetical protein